MLDTPRTPACSVLPTREIAWSLSQNLPIVVEAKQEYAGLAR